MERISFSTVVKVSSLNWRSSSDQAKRRLNVAVTRNRSIVARADQAHVHYFDREVCAPEDNPTIGLILCTDNNDAVVEYVLDKDDPVGQAARQLPELEGDASCITPPWKIQNFRLTDTESTQSVSEGLRLRAEFFSADYDLLREPNPTNAIHLAASGRHQFLRRRDSRRNHEQGDHCYRSELPESCHDEMFSAPDSRWVDPFSE